MPEKQRRSPMRPISEPMRAWAQALSGELETWQEVIAKNAFGMTLVYRGEVVFAALPATRALYNEDAILLKFALESPALARRIGAEPRLSAGTMKSKKRKGESSKWHIFLMRSDADVHGAIEWLAEAYRLAQPSRTSKRRASRTARRR